MLSFLATFVSAWFARVFAVRSWRKPVLALLAILFFGGLVFATPTFAQQAIGVNNDPNSFLDQVRQGTSEVRCSTVSTCIISIVTSGFTLILSILMYFLGKIIIVLTSVLIVVARYNDFANATPVTLGWPILRDVANMFFIVLLLVSAFMTILGIAKDYGLYWETQLPKLISAAILVNFSKTILMLGIDLSQVVMLAFINAFEGSIAGNFIQAIGLAQYLQIRAQAGPANAAQQTVNMVNIAISYILAIVLAIVAVSVLLMLIGYFVGRIITLWMILIFSPLIFLMSSLPSSIKSSMGEVGQLMGKYTGILVSGPTAAFMLWLTFATVQQAAGNPGNMIQGLNIAGQQSGVNGFLTSIGTDQGIANFIVAVAMMMMTLAVAQKAATSAGPIGAYIGDRAKGLANKGISWAQRGALLGDMARLTGRGVKGGARLAGRGLVKGVQLGYNAADKKYNITGTIGREVNRTFGDIPILGGYARQASLKMQNRRSGLIAEDDKKVSAQLQGIDKLSAREQVAIAQNLGRVDPSGQFLSGGAEFSPENIRAQHRLLSDEKNRKALLDMRQEEFAQQLRAAGTITDPDEIKRGATAMAQRSVEADERSRVNFLHREALNAGDATEAKRFADAREKSLMLMATDADYQKQVENIWNDPSKAKGLDASNFKDGQFAFDMMREAGALRVDAKTGEVQGVDMAGLSRFRDVFKEQKDLLQSADLVLKQVQETTGGRRVNRSEFTGAVAQKDPDGRVYFYNGQDGKKIRSDVEVDVDKRLRTEFAGRSSTDPLTDPQEKTINDALQVGIPIRVILDRTGEPPVAATGPTANNVVTVQIGQAIADAIHKKTPGESASYIAGLVDQMERANLSNEHIASLLSILAMPNPTTGDTVPDMFTQFRSLVGQERADVQRIIRRMVATDVNAQEKVRSGAAAALNASEAELHGLIQDMRSRFPEQETRDPGTGRVLVPAGPRGITVPLYMADT